MEKHRALHTVHDERSDGLETAPGQGTSLACVVTQIS